MGIERQQAVLDKSAILRPVWADDAEIVIVQPFGAVCGLSIPHAAAAPLHDHVIWDLVFVSDSSNQDAAEELAGAMLDLLGFVSRSAETKQEIIRIPFQDPAVGDVIEIEVTGLRHPLFGQRFAPVSVSRPRASGSGHILVAYQGRMQLRLPVAAASLAPQPPGGGLSKLTVEAVEELIALAEDSGGLACSSDPNAFGDAHPRRCGAC